MLSLAISATLAASTSAASNRVELCGNSPHGLEARVQSPGSTLTRLRHCPKSPVRCPGTPAQFVLPSGLVRPVCSGSLDFLEVAYAYQDPRSIVLFVQPLP